MEEILNSISSSVGVTSALTLVNVILSTIILIVVIFVFAKVRLLRKFLEK